VVGRDISWITDSDPNSIGKKPDKHLMGHGQCTFSQESDGPYHQENAFHLTKTAFSRHLSQVSLNPTLHPIPHSRNYIGIRKGRNDIFSKGTLESDL